MTLSSSLDISSDSLTVQSSRMKIHAANMANINTPYYVRKIPVLAEDTDASFQDIISSLRKGVITAGVSYGPGGVKMPGYTVDPTPGHRVYEPGPPQADKDGYITMSNVDPMTDMADAMSVSRLYEANLAVLGIVKTMATRALDIGRGS